MCYEYDFGNTYLERGQSGFCDCRSAYVQERVEGFPSGDGNVRMENLLCAHRNVDDGPLPIDEQESQIGGFQRIGQSLEGGKVRNWLAVQL